jgi:hypothetical protein
MTKAKKVLTPTELYERNKKNAIGLVVEKTSSGYMVNSSTGKGGYLVNTDKESHLACACMDQALNRGISNYRCKHIIAVENSLEKVVTNSSRFAALDL